MNVQPDQFANWKNPPAISLEACVPIEKSLGRNPFSDEPNDFALVTMYQEDHKRPSVPDNALFLVNGFIMDQEQGTQTLYFSALVVTVSNEDHGIRHVSSWILTDENSDGTLNRALYREKEVNSSGEEKVSLETEARSDQLATLQAYYHEAIHGLIAKADSELPESCEVAEGQDI